MFYNYKDHVFAFFDIFYGFLHFLRHILRIVMHTHQFLTLK